MVAANVKYETRIPQAAAEIRELWREELEDAADYGQRLIYQRAPVKTGKLRRNSRAEIEEEASDTELALRFYTRRNVPYGKEQERRRAYLSSSLYDTVDYIMERRFAFG